MEIKDMRQLPGEELRLELDKAREKIFRMRFHGKGKNLENPGLYKELKREVARMATVLSERDIERRRAREGLARKGKGPGSEVSQS